MSCKTEELSIDLLECAGEVGFVQSSSADLDGLANALCCVGVGKCRSIMYASSSIYTITILVLCPETTPRISSKPGSPTGLGPRAGPAMALCTPCSCRLAFTRLVGWVPCSLLHIYPRTMALCSSPVTRCAMSLMPRYCMANHYDSTRTCPRALCIRPGACNSMRDGHWYIRWHPAHMLDGLDCRLDHLHVTQETFRERHEQTRPWSPFNYELYARLIRGEAVVSNRRSARRA